MKVLQPKSPTEAVSILFDFEPYLAEGETLSNPTLDVRAVRNLDENPATRFSAPMIINGTVYTLMTDGTLGEDYEVICKVHTSNSQKLEAPMLQPVRDIRDT